MADGSGDRWRGNDLLISGETNMLDESGLISDQSAHVQDKPAHEQDGMINAKGPIHNRNIVKPARAEVANAG
jgi:hypothetical protein